MALDGGAFPSGVERVARAALCGRIKDRFGQVSSRLLIPGCAGAALACAVMGFPLLVRAIRLSVEAIDHRLEEAAGTCGASPAWIFVTVTLPLMTPGIVAGAILSFARSMGEFGATITFVSNIPGETQTLPTAIYTLTQVPGGESAALRLSIVSVILSMAALLLADRIARRVAHRVAGG